MNAMAPRRTPIASGAGRQFRRDVKDAERHRAADAQFAPRRALQTRDLGLCLLDFQQATLTALEECAPDLRETQAARGAIEQARAEAILQTGDVLAHHGFGQVELVGGGGKAAAVDHLNEHGDIVEGVHGAPDWWFDANNLIAGSGIMTFLAIYSRPLSWPPFGSHGGRHRGVDGNEEVAASLHFIEEF